MARAGEPSPAVAEIADAAWSHVLETRPYFALRTGHPVERLPRGTLAEAESDAAKGRQLRARLGAVDRDALTPSDWNTLAVLDHVTAQWTWAEDTWWTHFPVAPYQMQEPPVNAQQLLAACTFAGAADVERYLGLAMDVATGVRAATERVREQAERGWGLPRAALPGFVTAARGLRAGVADRLRVDETRTGALSAAQRGALTDGVDRVIDGEALPAFDELLEHLTGPAERTAVDGVGLAQYPGGEDAYRRLVRAYATFDVTPEEAHGLGVEQVEQLTELMAEARADSGFTGDEQAYRQALAADPRFHAGSPDEVADTYLRHVAAVEPVLHRWFAVTPAAPYGVERLDAALEPTMSYGYYEAPTPQQPVGRYRYNGSGLETRSQLNTAALILHELVPGHHFHLARQAEDTTLHPIRAELAPLTLDAYTEGWAEYAASLGAEMGVYGDPWDRYGSYQHQRFMAQRLVVDTGLNLFGWTLRRARDYMAATTMESERQIHTETLRYATDLPGQALGYRLGFLKLWELRHRAERALGAAFDVRDFHEVVLGAGALPFTAVEHNVDRYVREGATTRST